MPDRSQLVAFANPAVAQTDSALVTGVAGKRIHVTALYVGFAAAAPAASVTFNTKPAGAGSAISPLIVTSVVLPDGNWFQTKVGEGLTCTTGAGTNPTGILVAYTLVS